MAEVKKSIKVGLTTIVVVVNRITYYSLSDIEKAGNANKVTININAYRTSEVNTLVTFLTNKKYNIDDVVYFTKIK